jgi:hypothetical protein
MTCHYDHLNSHKSNAGTAAFVMNYIFPVSLNFKTSLQGIASCVHVPTLSYTVCSIYFPPVVSVSGAELMGLISEYPTPFILLGNFNAHNVL